MRYYEKRLTVAEILERIENCDSIELITVMQNAIHWGEHLTRETRAQIVLALHKRYNWIVGDHG